MDPPSAPPVTVILTTYDRPALLQRAIASVVGQSDPRWSLIIIDDGVVSSPPPLGDRRIQYVRTSGRTGAAAARNTGMALAQSNWVVLLDDDDEMEATWVSHFIDSIAGNVAQPAFALSDWRILDYGSAADIPNERRRTYDIRIGQTAHNIHQALRAGACGLAVNRLALEYAGPMDGEYKLTEDTEWILRLVEAGCDILYASGPGFIIHNRRTPDQLSDSHRLADRIDECRLLQARYGDLGGRFPGLNDVFDGLIASFQSRLRQAQI